MRRTFLKNTVLAVAALSLSTLVYAGEALDRVMNKGVESGHRCQLGAAVFFERQQ